MIINSSDNGFIYKASMRFYFNRDINNPLKLYFTIRPFYILVDEFFNESIPPGNSGIA